MTRSRCLTYTFLLVTAILFCWWYWVTPYYNDDICFTSPWCVQQTGESWLEYNAKSPMTWHGYVDKAYLLFHEDAFRGFNLLVPWFLWLPKCIFNLLTTALFFGTLLICLKLITCPLQHYNRVALLAISLLLFMPWEIGMNCVAHTINYIWPLFFLSLYLYYYQNIDRLSLWPLICVALILGGGHEMLGLPLFGVTLFTNWGNSISPVVRRNRWVASICALIPTIILIIIAYNGRLPHSTGYILLNTNEGETFVLLVRRLIFVVPFSFLSLMVLPFVWKRVIKTKWVIYLLTLSFLFLLEGLVLNRSGSRVYIWTAFMSIILFYTMVNIAHPRPYLSKKILALTLWLSMLVGISVNFITGIYWTNRLGKEEDVIRREYYYGHSQNQFYPMTPPSHISVLAYHRLCFLFQYYRCNYWGQHMWRKDPAFNIPHPMAIPLVLKDIVDEEILPVQGCSSVLKARDWYISHDSLTIENMTPSCLPKGTFDVVSTPFLRDDGEKFYFITFLYIPIWLEGGIGFYQIYAR